MTVELKIEDHDSSHSYSQVWSSVGNTILPINE